MKLPAKTVVPLGATHTPKADRLHVGEPRSPDGDSGPEFPLVAAARDFAAIEEDQVGVAVIDDDEPPAAGDPLASPRGDSDRQG